MKCSFRESKASGYCVFFLLPWSFKVPFSSHSTVILSNARKTLCHGHFYVARSSGLRHLLADVAVVCYAFVMWLRQDPGEASEYPKDFM